jgi:hypothetical protein
MLTNQHRVIHLNDPKLSRAKYWMLLQDNAPFCSLLVWQPTKQGTLTLVHSPYSCNHLSCHPSLLLQTYNLLRVCHVKDVKEFQMTCNPLQGTICGGFQKCFKKPLTPFHRTSVTVNMQHALTIPRHLQSQPKNMQNNGCHLYSRHFQSILGSKWLQCLTWGFHTAVANDRLKISVPVIDKVATYISIVKQTWCTNILNLC